MLEQMYKQYQHIFYTVCQNIGIIFENVKKMIEAREENEQEKTWRHTFQQDLQEM